ncbi:polymerase-like protein, kappa [Phlyctochytrium arcticum]|nr:polymerase-like protein, kappa [Phlyctochytrium arcticum]
MSTDSGQTESPEPNGEDGWGDWPDWVDGDDFEFDGLDDGQFGITDEAAGNPTSSLVQKSEEESEAVDPHYPATQYGLTPEQQQLILGPDTSKQSSSTGPDAKTTFQSTQPLVNAAGSGSTREISAAEKGLRSRLLINPNKAGTQYVTRERVEEVVYEMSKGSRFFLAEQKRDEMISEKIARLKVRVDALQGMDLRHEIVVVESTIRAVEQEWEASERRWIVCVDMDAYFAAVEELYRPDLKNKPMAVGGMSMLSTANYEARKYGVRSAMPGYIAKKLCPDLILMKGSYDKYAEISKVIRGVFAIYDPNFSPLSLDEAFLDINDYLAAHPEHTPETLVQELREEITRRTKLTASAGIAANKMLAKVCADINKPNGQKFLPQDRESIMEFVRTLPIRKVPGVGRVQERIFRAFGIENCGQLRENLVMIYKLFSMIMFQFCVRAALGIGSTQIESEWERKSIGCERTFTAITTPTAMYAKLHDLSHLLALDLTRQDSKGKTLTLKLKTPDFQLCTRAKSLGRFISTSEEIYEVGQKLLATELAARPNLSLRLMGLSMSKLSSRSIPEKGIAKFLKSPPSPSPTLSATCPVCQKVLQGVTERQVSEHVGRCLDDPVAGDVQPNEGKRKREGLEGWVVLGSDGSEQPAPGSKKPAVEGSGAHSPTIKPSETPHLDNLPSPEVPTTSITHPPGQSSPSQHPSYLPTCPICTRPFPDPSNLASVNTHIDACLSGQQLPTPSTASPMRKEKTQILDYFKK